MANAIQPIKRLTMSTPAAYLIRVQGWVDESWTDYFDNLSVVVSAPVGIAPETTFCGQVHDQTALLGILRRLRELKTTLISIEYLPA